MYVDFSKRQRRYLPVKLKNGARIDVEEPTMQILESLQKVEETGSLKDLNRMVCTIINRNKQKKKFSKEEIVNMLTAEDMHYLIQCYADFAVGIRQDPN